MKQIVITQVNNGFILDIRTILSPNDYNQVPVNWEDQVKEGVRIAQEYINKDPLLENIHQENEKKNIEKDFKDGAYVFKSFNEMNAFINLILNNN